MIDTDTYSKILKSVRPGLVKRYSEPHRKYHGVHHLNDMLNLLTSRFHHNTPISALIIWYHDAIYNPTANDNEEKSAELAVTELKGFVESADLDIIANGILLTKHQFPPHCLNQPYGTIIDLDLSILAHEWMYWNYARAIREEYHHVDDKKYISGRIEFLEKMKGRNKIFSDNLANDKIAVENMQREIQFLKKNNLQFE